MIMELDELKTLWSEYDKKLEQNLQLNMQLLRKMNFDKARFKVRMFYAWRIVQMLITNYAGFYLILFAAKNLDSPQFSIPAIIVAIAVYSFFALDLKMLGIIEKLRLKNNNVPIAPLLKKTEKLKVLTVRYVKYALFAIPLYPIFMLLIGKIFLNVDFSSPHYRLYLIANIIVGLLLLPLIISIFTELSKKEIEKPWVKTLLCGSGFYLANDAETFLNEVAKFEKE